MFPAEDIPEGMDDTGGGEYGDAGEGGGVDDGGFDFDVGF